MADFASINDRSQYEIDVTENAHDQRKSLSVTVEALTQEVHELRCRLQVAQDIERHFIAEVEILHQNEGRLKESHESCMQQLRDQHNIALQEWTHKVESLEQDLEELREAHAQVLLRLEEQEKSSKESADVTDSLAALRAELQEVLSARDDDKQACQQHQELNQILMEEKVELNSQLEFMKEQLETAQARYEIANNDLKEQAESFDELRAALQVAQSELACLKAVPLAEKSRGNSLFAEVEDNRKAVEKRLSSFKQKYIHMEREYSAKCAEITKLRKENVQLHRKWEEEDKERDDREVWLVDNYEIRIKELEKTVQSLKQEEKPVFVHGDSEILNYASHITETSRKEIHKLREEMEWRSAERLNEAKALNSVRRDRQSLRSKLMSAQAENSLLRERLKQANIADDLPSPRPIFKCKCQTEESGKGLKQNEVSAEVNPHSSIVKLIQRGLADRHSMIHPSLSLQAKSSGLNYLKEKPVGESKGITDEALAHVAEQSPASRAVNTSATTFTVSNVPNLATELKQDYSNNSPIISEYETDSVDTTDGQVCDKLPDNSTDKANVASEAVSQESLASEDSNEPPVASATKHSTEPLDHSSSLCQESQSEIVQRRNIPLRVLRAELSEKNLPLNLPQPLSNASDISSGKAIGVFSENLTGQSLASLPISVSETEEEQLSASGWNHVQPHTLSNYSVSSKHPSFTKSLSSTSEPNVLSGSVEAAGENAETHSTFSVDKDVSSTFGPVFSQNNEETSDARAFEATETMATRVGPTKSILSNTGSRASLATSNHLKSRNVRFVDESESEPGVSPELNEVFAERQVSSASPKRNPKVVKRNYPVWSIS